MKKHKHIDPAALGASIPPPSAAFADDTMAQLRQLAAKEEKPVKRKTFSAVLIAALLIALLAATALAVSLRRSAEADILYQARQAIIAQYGLTYETLGMFYPEMAQDGSTWTVTMVCDSNDPTDKLGIYTVVLAPGADPAVTWSHDDIDPALWQNGGLDAPAWGQPQMEQLLLEQMAKLDAWRDIEWSSITLEEHMALHPTFQDHNEHGNLVTFDRVLPGEEDISIDDARQLAAKALLDTYGIAPETLEGYDWHFEFVKPQVQGPRQYHIVLNRMAPEYEVMNVRIASPTGEVLQCTWHAPGPQRTLPDGPLDGYKRAVQEFMEAGGLKARSAADKADIAQRVRDAGYELFIMPILPYAHPEAGDMPEADAITRADAALAEDFEGITPDTLALFGKTTALLADDDGRRWQVTYAPPPVLTSDRVWSEIIKRLGVYTVEMDAATGDILRATWNLAHYMGDTAYAPGTWGGEEAYGSAALPWLLALKAEVDAIRARYPEEAIIYDYSIEDAGAYDTLFRDAGFPADEFYHAVPDDKALPYAQALALAKQALMEEMGMPETTLDNANLLAEYMLPSGAPRWYFAFHSQENGIEVMYSVMIDPYTGEILRSSSISGGNG